MEALESEVEVLGSGGCEGSVSISIRESPPKDVLQAPDSRRRGRWGSIQRR